MSIHRKRLFELGEIGHQLQKLDVEQYETSKCSKVHDEVAPGKGETIQMKRHLCAGGVEGNI